MNFLKLENSIVKIFLELFIFNRKKRSILKARWVKKNLLKYADFALKEPFEEVLPPVNNNREYIWQYWHQGRENAPLIIQKCLESVEKYEGDKNIRVLSFDTIKDYVELPQKYYDLLESKRIPIAIFSDILRLYLLEKYGGCWVDSTIFLTDRIPQEVWNADFCVFQKNPSNDMHENKMSCYFIRAAQNSINLRAIKRAIEKYWHEQDFLINYFMFEHLSTLLSDRNSLLKSEWDKMPYLDGELAGKLQRIMFDKFDTEIWTKLKSECSIHKLSYKNLKSDSGGNSYYDYIIEDK